MHIAHIDCIMDENNGRGRRRGLAVDRKTIT